MAVDVIAEQLGLVWENNKKFKAEITASRSPRPSADGRGVGGEGEVFVKPQTFMNLSGESVQAILSYYKLLPKSLGIVKKKDADLSQILIVIHDDLDIDLGKFKISTDSRAAGHNGVQSIINHLKTKNFTRIRIGIKTPMKEKIPTERFVLQRFSEEELLIIKKVIDEISF
jgi:PTH1 family peptidyl-tRNA hydrolase